jgi:hypothetical protein
MAIISTLRMRFGTALLSGVIIAGLSGCATYGYDDYGYRSGYDSGYDQSYSGGYYGYSRGPAVSSSWRSCPDSFGFYDPWYCGTGSVYYGYTPLDPWRSYQRFSPFHYGYGYYSSPRFYSPWNGYYNYRPTPHLLPRSGNSARREIDRYGSAGLNPGAGDPNFGGSLRPRSMPMVPNAGPDKFTIESPQRGWRQNQPHRDLMERDSNPGIGSMSRGSAWPNSGSSRQQIDREPQFQDRTMHNPNFGGSARSEIERFDE